MRATGKTVILSACSCCAFLFALWNCSAFRRQLSDSVCAYRSTDCLPLLRSPPSGTAIYMVRAGKSDRWNSEIIEELELATQESSVRNLSQLCCVNIKCNLSTLFWHERSFPDIEFTLETGCTRDHSQCCSRKCWTLASCGQSSRPSGTDVTFNELSAYGNCQFPLVNRRMAYKHNQPARPRHVQPSEDYQSCNFFTKFQELLHRPTEILLLLE